MELPERSIIKKSDCWNVEAMFASYEDWNKKFSEIVGDEKNCSWPEILELKGTLKNGPEQLKKLYDNLLKVERELVYLYTYAHLRHDEDISNNEHKAGLIKITSVLHHFAQFTSWVDPEILSLTEETIQSYLKSDLLKEYAYLLETKLRLKAHTLSPSEENLLALAGEALGRYSNTFSAINDADFDFGFVQNSKNEELKLSHASYGMYLREQDRVLRENSFNKMHKKYEKYENTLTELLNGVIQSHFFYARAKKYNSCLEASIYPHNIPNEVYYSLVEAVNKKISVLHKYMDLRQKVMGVPSLHLYDMYVPLTKDFDIKMSFEKACDLIIDSVAPLGKEYQEILKNGLKKDRWVDCYENKSKRSGAYSSGCYDSMPYILMNYKDILRDVFTLAHEAGHSMHSYYTHKNQPYQYGNYPIFLAEVASTFNEELLMRLMLERAESKDEKIFLLNMKIDDIRGTLFRQTMFAEFELLIHSKAERYEPLTPQVLKKEFFELNKKYFGPNVVIDEVSSIEWARIPHFYYNFYVYQYATGISAALALCDRVCGGGDKEREDYLGFLKSGSSKYPVETLKIAGVDLSTSQPIEAAIDRFGTLVDELGRLF